jgi:hypothetical protein
MGPLETEEFEVSEYPPEYVTVGLDESIQSILERVEEGWVRSPNVVLVIPRGAQAFHNTHDFLALGKLPGGRQVRVSIASPDPTIAGLARVLGFYIVDVPPDHPALTQDPTLGLSRDDDIEKPTSPLPLGVGMGSWGKGTDWVLTESQQATPTPRRNSLTTSTWLGNPENYEPISAGATPKILGEAQSPKAEHAESALDPKASVPPRTRPRQTSQLSSVALDSTSLRSARDGGIAEPTPRIPRSRYHAPQVSPTPSGRIKARSVMVPDETRINERKLRYGGDIDKKFSWGRLFAILLLLVVGGLVGGSYYAFTYLPEATIAVTPLDKTISGMPVELTILLSTQQRPVSTDLGATLVKGSITEEGVHPATGTRQVPRGKAQGTMHFTNRTEAAVVVSVGMTFKAPNGVTVQITQGGTVRATDFNSGSFGTLDLPIAATVEGPGGNIGAEQISGNTGKLNYYNTAMQGGSLETLKVVTQEDIDALTAQLRTQADAKVGSTILALVPPGQDQVLITQTVQVANMDITPDHKADDVADSVSARLTAEVRAYTYKDSDIQAAVIQTAYDWVRTNISSTVGPNLDPNSVKYAPIIVKSFDPAQGKVVYTTSASGRVTFTLTNELARQIRDLVKGKDVKQARNLITQQYGNYVNPLSVQAKVLWLTVDKLPTDPARISIEASAPPGLYTPGGSTAPSQGTSDATGSRP